MKRVFFPSILLTHHLKEECLGWWVCMLVWSVVWEDILFIEDSNVTHAYTCLHMLTHTQDDCF